MIGSSGVIWVGCGKMGSVACWKTVDEEHINEIHCVKEDSSRGSNRGKSEQRSWKNLSKFSPYPFYLKITHSTKVDPNKRTYMTSKTKS